MHRRHARQAALRRGGAGTSAGDCRQELGCGQTPDQAGRAAASPTLGNSSPLRICDASALQQTSSCDMGSERPEAAPHPPWRPRALQEEVERAVRAARIPDLPAGYATVLQGGVYLSMGERRRLTIARALLKDAPALILDKAMASVGLDDERLIQEALQTLTLTQTDQIAVPDRGHVLATVGDWSQASGSTGTCAMARRTAGGLCADGGFWQACRPSAQAIPSARPCARPWARAPCP